MPCLHSPLVDTSVPSMSMRGFGEELCGLLCPNLQPRLVDHIQQRAHLVGLEAPTEVAGGGGIGNPPGVHRLQISFILTPQFEIFQAGAVTQGVQGEVQYVVALVVRQMDLQELQPTVQCFGQPELAHQQQHRADATIGQALRALGQFVLDVGRPQHRLLAAFAVELVQPLLDAAACVLPDVVVCCCSLEIPP